MDHKFPGSSVSKGELTEILITRYWSRAPEYCVGQLSVKCHSSVDRYTDGPIRNKIFVTLASNAATSGNKTCFLQVHVARTVAQHCMEGIREGKLYFISLF